MIREILPQLRASKKTIPSFVVMIIIFQSIIPILQAWDADPQPDYQIFIVPFIENCDLMKYPQRDHVKLIDNVTGSHDGVYENTRNPLKWWINCLSYHVFHTPKLLPIFFNIGLMPLVYLITLELSKDKIIAILSLVAFVANPLYHDWLGSGTYDQIWSFFLMLSVYVMFKFKKDYGSSMFLFFISLTAKTLGLLYLPALFYSQWKTTKSKYTKLIFIGGISFVILLVGLTQLHNQDKVLGGSIGYYPEHLKDALLRNFEMMWNIAIFLVLFVLLSTNFRPSRPTPNKRLVVVWMINGLFTTFVIYLFSTQFQFVYRFVPFAVFMSIFIGMTIIDTGNCVLELILKRQERKNNKLLTKD